MGAPDVSVLVPVFNTMPYLRRCLASLVGQSIGADRMEIIAVDDGSTDGSARELNRFARRHPDIVTVVHQPNSGGPAAPCNRALDLATGRYVFFIGADDYLGVQALQRLVAAADEYGSDVVLGKVVGVNSRHVHQAIFARTEPDVDLFDSALVWSLANTKLFRRELIERHKLRYPQDMSIGSDQPFTLEACLRARRISVLADYEYYYAVRRLNAANITYASRHEARLRCAEQLMDFVARIIEPGPHRDAVMVRHTTWELARLLEDDVLRLDRTVLQRVHAGVKRLVDSYLTEAVVARLDVEASLRLGMARDGTLDDLLAMIRQDARVGVPATVVEGERCYAAYPGFRDPQHPRPDQWYDVTAKAAAWLARFDATSMAWRRRSDGRQVLTISARSPVSDLTTNARLVAATVGEVGATIASTTSDASGTTVGLEVGVDALVSNAWSGQRRRVQMEIALKAGSGAPAVSATGAASTTAVAALRTPRLASIRPLVLRRGLRLFAITPTKDHSGHLMIAVIPITRRRVIARLLRRFTSQNRP